MFIAKEVVVFLPYLYLSVHILYFYLYQILIKEFWKDTWFSVLVGFFDRAENS
jgi:hypothetical protein